MSSVRFQIYDAGYEASVAALRNAMGEEHFESAWAEGAALSVDEAIAYDVGRAGPGAVEVGRRAGGITHVWNTSTPPVDERNYLCRNTIAADRDVGRWCDRRHLGPASEGLGWAKHEVESVRQAMPRVPP